MEPEKGKEAPKITQSALIDLVKGIVKEAVGAAVAPLAETQRVHSALFAQVKQPEEEVPKGTRIARAIKSVAFGKAQTLPPQEAAKLLYPRDEKLHEAMNVTRQKALGEALGATGGFIVPPEYSMEIIEFLRDASVFRRAGPRILPMNSNVMNIPRQDTGAVAAYAGESANVTKTEPTLGQIQLSAKKLAALVPMSNEIIRDPSPSADAWVRDDLVQALGVRQDVAFLRDDGTANKPKGVRFWVDSANVTAANTTVNLANTVADLKTSIKKFKQGRKGNVIRPVWFMSTRTEQYLLHLTTGAPERYFFRDEMLGAGQLSAAVGALAGQAGKFFGWPYYVTDQIPDNIGGASNGSELYLVDMFEAIIGENMALEIAVSSEAAYHDGSVVQAAFSRDETVIRAIARHDFALRHGKGAHILDDVRWV